MRTTKHGFKRIKGRLNLNKRMAQRTLDRAWSKGLTHKDSSGEVRKYINALYLRHKTANNIRLYHHYAYIFVGHTFLTVIPMPPELYKATDEQTAERDLKLKEKK